MPQSAPQPPKSQVDGLKQGVPEVIGRLSRVMLALAALSPTVALAQEEYQSFSGPGQIGLQRSVTPLMDSIVTFHNGVLLWTITLIVLLVAAIMPSATQFPPPRHTIRLSRSFGRLGPSSS